MCGQPAQTILWGVEGTDGESAGLGRRIGQSTLSIDPLPTPSYSAGAELARPRTLEAAMGEFDLDRLERQVDRLLRQLERLRDENASLRASQEHLVAERADLIEKTELARSKVEAMVARLKAMEEQL